MIKTCPWGTPAAPVPDRLTADSGHNKDRSITMGDFYYALPLFWE